MRTEEQKQAALKLNAKRVRLAVDVFAEVSNGRDLDGGCDDLEWPDYMSEADRRALIDDYHMWNGDPEEAAEWDSIGFSSAFAYLSEALLKFAAESLK